MRSRLVVLTAVLALCATTANAEPKGRWWSGWGQGVTEYGFNDGMGSEIYIACTDSPTPNDKNATSIRVSVKGVDPAPGSEVVFIVGQDSFSFVYDRKDNLIATASHVDASNFYALWEAIIGGSSLNLMITDRIGNKHMKTFPLKGSAKALGSEACKTDFAR